MGSIMKLMKRLIKKAVKIPVLFLYRLFVLINRVDKQIILFESNLGRNYSGNPRFIYEEMVARGLDKQFRCFFILEDTGAELPGNAIKVKRISLNYFFIFSKAGYWVSDTRMPSYLVKRKKTIYIQTWHGTPLKRLALDMFNITMEGEADLDSYKKNFIKNSSSWDYLLSQNSYSTGIFRRAFAYEKEILEIGYPRNDLLINQNNYDRILELKQRFHLPMDKKIILYAPTWRDNEFIGPHQYKFSTRIDFDYLRKSLSKDYIILVKAHYLVSEVIDGSKYQGFLFSFGASDDIAELYLIADLLITDYSSVMFDYSLLDRPMLFFAYDLDQYKDQLRGFYFDFLEEAPGPVVVTTQQLVQSIISYDQYKYKEKIDAFKKKYNHADHGTASAVVVDLILSHGGIGN
ncbi:MAG: tagF [Herbinix sp.]|jgi:CDP-glycerol glycerophosphotransferase|nr:tagF [Herbinix sp.]